MKPENKFSWSGVLSAFIALAFFIFFRAFTTEAPDPCEGLTPDPLEIRTPDGCEAPAMTEGSPDDPLDIRGSLH